MPRWAWPVVVVFAGGFFAPGVAHADASQDGSFVACLAADPVHPIGSWLGPFVVVQLGQGINYDLSNGVPEDHERLRVAYAMTGPLTGFDVDYILSCARTAYRIPAASPPVTVTPTLPPQLPPGGFQIASYVGVSPEGESHSWV
jgi:hypothetical protein